MIELIDGLPERVLGLRATGEVTADDYRNVIGPEISAKAAHGSPIGFLYVLEDGAGYDAAAMGEDAQLGADHLRDFGRVAVVTDDGRFRAAVGLLSLVMPGRVRYFGHADLAEAATWVEQLPPATSTS